MRFIRGLLWFLVVVAIVALAVYLTGGGEGMDRLTALFWAVQLRLPLAFNFEQFLVILCAVSVLVAFLVISGCAAILVVMANRHSRSAQQGVNQIAASKREIAHVREQHQRQYEALQSVGQALARRLDKELLLQALLDAASRVTTSAQANSLASLWLLDPETDAFRFERGLYCDETMFAKTEFQPTEPPFARVVPTQQPWRATTSPAEVPAFVKPDQYARLGAATGLILVPFVSEERVVAILAVFCHPDLLKSYETQEAFYNVMWTELGLAAVIAIQGAVTILDRLTGAHTREYFMKRLIQEIERANRYQLPLSFLMIDIDNFKLVNDMLGHQQGDAALKIVARLIRNHVRVIDLVGRYGGEEFVVMLPETGYGADLTSVAGAVVVAERIRKTVEAEFRGLQKPLNLTVSVGVAIRRFPEDRDADYQQLIRLADEQLYRAKTSGKNAVCSALPEAP